MSQSPNTLRWDGAAGHYEVYYLSLTDPESAVGLWIRYTMLAPLGQTEPASCALWLMAMDPPGGEGVVFARKQTLPISALSSTTQPFSLQIGDACLDDHGMKGDFQDVSFDLSWKPCQQAYQHVHPALRRARIAKTVLELPHADLQVSGAVSFAGRELQLDRAPAGQAHLWGSKHAARWAWLHTNDLRTPDGERMEDSFIDAVSVFVPRFGRQLGPSTPLVARFAGRDFISTSPARVLANRSRIGLTGWQLQASDGKRRLELRVTAPRERLVGVTYQDPDGERAYCYNTEVASLEGSLSERAGKARGDWSPIHRFSAAGATHFEYAQRTPLPDVPLLLS